MIRLTGNNVGLRMTPSETLLIEDDDVVVENCVILFPSDFTAPMLIISPKVKRCRITHNYFGYDEEHEPLKRLLKECERANA